MHCIAVLMLWCMHCFILIVVVDTQHCLMSGEGAVAGQPGDGRGSGWNDPPASHYSSSPRGSLPRKRIAYPLQADSSPSGKMITELLHTVEFAKTVEIHFSC